MAAFEVRLHQVGCFARTSPPMRRAHPPVRSVDVIDSNEQKYVLTSSCWRLIVFPLICSLTLACLCYSFGLSFSFTPSSSCCKLGYPLSLFQCVNLAQACPAPFLDLRYYIGQSNHLSSRHHNR